MKDVAIIGCGKVVEGKEGWAIGSVHGGAWKDRFPEYRLHAVDIAPENLTAFGKRFDIPPERQHASEDELYAATTPDVVSICTWPALHAPMVHRAIKEGVRGIVCEKPMALSPCEIREMIADAQQHGVSLSIAHQRRHNPLVGEVKKLIAGKRLGESVVIECRVMDNWDILSWTSHWFDLVNCIMDGPPLGLIAGMDHQFERRYQHAVERQSIVLAEYEGGHQGIFITGPENPGIYPITVRGEKGIALISEEGPLRLMLESGYEEIALDKESFTNLYQRLFEELIHAMDNGSTPLCDVSKTADGTLMCFAAHESARTQSRVSWPITFEHAGLEVLQQRPRTRFSELKACIYADGHVHDGREVLQGAVDTIARLMHNDVKVLDAKTHALTEADLRGMDLLCLFHYEPEATEETKAALRGWIEGGKPVMMLHSAIGAYRDWEEFHKWCGLVWKWGVSGHPFQPCTLKATDWAKGLFTFTEAWLPHDEIYMRLREAAQLEPLLTSEVDGETVIRAWLNKEYPNIVGFNPGHTNAIWRLPVVEQVMHSLLAKLFPLKR